MIDKSHPAPRPADRPASRSAKRRPPLPAFAPVPRQTQRHDGWTPERQTGFIEALADLGSVRAAAHAVNMTPEGAYLLRRHADAGEFRQAWEAALALGVQRLEDVAMERALHGVEVPVYSYGKIVGTRRVYNDRLMMFLLRHRAPKRFAANATGGASPRPDAATRAHIARLERERRKVAFNESLERSKELNRRFAQAHTEFVRGMSDETLRYYKAFRLALGAQRRRLTLAELGMDPLSPDFPIDDHLRKIDAGPPTDLREQMQEMSASLDTADRYLERPRDWREELEDEEDEDED